MGEKNPPDRWKFDLDCTVPSSRVAFAVFDMTHKMSNVLYPQRYDFKARGHSQGLELRRDWQSLDERNFLAAGHVVSPLSRRGEEAELAVRNSFNPVFPSTKWKFGELNLHDAVPPSPPYRDWVVVNEPPRLRRNITERETVLICLSPLGARGISFPLRLKPKIILSTPAKSPALSRKLTQSFVKIKP